jgi:uncharacterized coiled-coil protein SlyX
MELLDQLERRVTSLLTRLDNLSRENVELRKALEVTSAAQEAEIHRLGIALEEERQKNTTALMRVETLVDRIKERTPE